jgi:hypothetical protein
MRLGKEFSCMSIGGTPYREGIFSTWNDPAKFGLFYQAALMTRRGDVARSEHLLAVTVDQFERKDFPNTGAIAEACRVGGEYEGYPAKDADARIRLGEPHPALSDTEVRSDTGELYRSWVKEYGSIDTPRTKAVYGSLAKNGCIELDGMSVKATTTFAVVALSSLTDSAISASDNMLLTAVGRARNHGAQFESNQMLDYGTNPIEIEVIEADVAIRTEQQTLSVWAISAEGFYVGRIPAVYEEGWFKFTLGKNFPSMYYLIRAE